MHSLVEVIPSIPDGPSWAIAIALSGNILVRFIPALTARWDVNACKKRCAEISAENLQLKQQITDMQAKDLQNEKRISKVYGWLFAIKGKLEDLGVENIADLIDDTNG
jgi:hypothetical protein